MSPNLYHILADKSRIEIILDFLPYPFIISEKTNGTQVNIYANKKFIEEIGYTLEEIPDITSWFEKAYPEPLYRSAIESNWHQLIEKASKRGDDSVLMRVIITTKNNGDKWYEVKCSVSGPLQLIAFVNITDVMAKERELERLNENKNQTLSILAHDIRGPLSNLNTMTRWMLEGNFDQTEFNDRLTKINAKSSQVLEFIETTLLWTRANFNSMEFKPEDVNVSEIFEKILGIYENLYEVKSITIAQNFSHNVLHVDREILQIVVRNIISNAIKFTHDKGHIVISSKKEKNYFYLSISDNGIGISPAMLEKIQYDQYASTPGTREEKGLGLGLKLCRQLLKKIDSRMAINSTEGSGTHVKIIFPVLE